MSVLGFFGLTIPFLAAIEEEFPPYPAHFILTLKPVPETPNEFALLLDSIFNIFLIIVKFIYNYYILYFKCILTLSL